MRYALRERGPRPAPAREPRAAGCGRPVVTRARRTLVHAQSGQRGGDGVVASETTVLGIIDLYAI